MIDNNKENSEDQAGDSAAKPTAVKKARTKKKTTRKAKAKTKPAIETEIQSDDIPAILQEESTTVAPISINNIAIALVIIVVVVIFLFIKPLSSDIAAERPTQELPEEKMVIESNELTLSDKTTNESTENIDLDVVDDTVVIEDTVAIEETLENETIIMGNGWALTKQADDSLILKHSQEDMKTDPVADINLEQLREKLTPHGWGVWPDAEGGIIMVPGGARDIPAILQQTESVNPDIAELRKQLTPHGWGVWPDGEGGVILIPGMPASPAP